MNDTAIDVVRLQATARAGPPGRQALSGSTRQQLYDSLPVFAIDQNIRLLYLKPLPPGSTINPNNVPLTGKLCVVSLKSRPCFAALSYVWGGYSSPKPDVLRIRLDNGVRVKIDITSNCKDALLALRERYGAICIWIDAICINQVDQVEKASQLMLMGDIYTWAEMVYVWLGPETDASRRAFRSLQIASQYKLFLDVVAIGSAVDRIQFEARRRMIFDIVWWRFFPSLWKYQRALTYLWLSLLTFWQGNMLNRLKWGLYGLLDRSSMWTDDLDFLTTDLTNIIERPWFKRGWTFQEIVLASDVTVMCGSTTIKWDVLIRGLSRVFRYNCMPGHWFSNFPNDESKKALEGLINIWMHLERPTVWNGIRMKRKLRGKTTMDHYQLAGQNSLINLPCFTCFGLLRLLLLFIGWIHISLNWLLFLIIIGIGPAFARIAWPPKIGCVHWSGYSPFSDVKCLETGLTTWADASMQIAYIFLIWCVVAGTMALIQLLTTNFHWIYFWFNMGRQQSSFRWWDLSGYYQRMIRGKFGVDFTRGNEPSSLDIPANGVIRALRERQTTEPKDRSYAAYAVLSRLGVKPVAPDYSKHLGLVYREHFQQLILWNPGLLNLVIDVDGQQLEGAPSWVPNWDTAATSSWIGSPEAYDMPRFNSPKYSVPQCQGLRLHVLGQKIATVAYSSGRFTMFGPELELQWSQWERSRQYDLMVVALKFADWLRYVKSHVSTTFPYELSLPELVSRVFKLCYFKNEPARFIQRPETIVALDLGQETIAATGDKFDTWYRSVSTVPTRPLERAMRQISGGIDEILFGEVFRAPEDCRHNKSIRQSTAKLSSMLAGKRNLFVTNNGLVGSGCERMELNDHIYWIDGVSVPMALRPARTSTNSSLRFTVVGPVYVYGFMGEGVRDKSQLVSVTLV